jgi:hypothetical protein
MNKQYFKTENYYIELSNEGMIVIEYREWNSSAVGVDEYFFPRDWSVFFKLFTIAQLQPIGEYEFSNMYFQAKVKNQLLAA